MGEAFKLDKSLYNNLAMVSSGTVQNNMKALHFEITIFASKEKVWDTMLDLESFKIWTAAFAAGSYFEGSWLKGEKIKFLTPDGDGMTSLIAENKPYQFISIKHLGIIKNGIEDTESPEITLWAPSFENYFLSERDGATVLKVDMEVTPELKEYMERAWPNALLKLKEICE